MEAKTLSLILELNELEAINFAHSCHRCESNINLGNLSELNFLPPLQFAKFGRKYPDLSFFRPILNKKEVFALVVEVKSGRVREEDLKEQAIPLSKLDLYEVNHAFKIHADRNQVLGPYKKWPITGFSVCFQYYDEVLTGIRPEEKTFLDELVKHVTILNCRKGLDVKVLGGKAIEDEQTRMLYERGIAMPHDAPRLVLFAEHPSDELIAFRICEHVIEVFATYPRLDVSAESLKHDLFAQYEPLSPGRLQVILKRLNQIGICTKKRPEGGMNLPPIQEKYEFDDIVCLRDDVMAKVRQGATLLELVGAKKP